MKLIMANCTQTYEDMDVTNISEHNAKVGKSKICRCCLDTYFILELLMRKHMDLRHCLHFVLPSDTVSWRNENELYNNYISCKH